LTYDDILGEAKLLSDASARHYSVVDPAHYAGYAFIVLATISLFFVPVWAVIMIAAIGGVSWVLALTCLWKGNGFDGRAREIWRKRYSTVAWQSAVGEQFAVLNSCDEGKFLLVDYGYGDRGYVIATTMKPMTNTWAIEMRPPVDETRESTFERKLRTKWRTPEGDVGALRTFEVDTTENNKFDYIFTLKLSDGRSVTFREDQLTEAYE
jgi:hypothetical protein